MMKAEQQEQQSSNNGHDDAAGVSVEGTTATKTGGGLMVLPTTVASSSVSSLVVDDYCTLKILSFLDAKDLLSVQGLNRYFHQKIIDHDEILFSACLQHDFYEGKVLSYAVSQYYGSKNQNNSSSSSSSSSNSTTTVAVASTATTTAKSTVTSPYKRVYLAFQNRWKLCKQESKSIKIHWRSPDHIPRTDNADVDSFIISPKKKEISTIMTDDVRALVFIVRIGEGGDAVGLMEWTPEEGGREDQLIMDKEMWDDEDWREGFNIPKEICDKIENWRTDQNFDKDSYERLRTYFCLSLHVVDMERFRAMSILEETPAEEIENHEIDNFSTFSGITAYGHVHKYLFGIPHPGSPYHRPLEECNFNSVYDFDQLFDFPRVESVDCWGHLEIGRDLQRESMSYKDGSGISFSFDSDASVTVGYEICNFYRALMKEKCVYGGVHVIPSQALAPRLLEQPLWVKDKKIVDTIISFLPFKEQAGMLRLVCRPFKDSAIRQLEIKLLDEIKVIGFDRYESGGWFKAQVRRGWSDDPFATTEDSVIDDAFWLASCRCSTFSSCKNSDSCKNTQKGIADALDVKQARAVLREQGRIKRVFENKYETNHDIRRLEMNIKFSSKPKTIFAICNEILWDIMYGSVSYEMIPKYLRRDYGICGRMSNGRFLRSLFLVFNHIPDSMEASNPTKKVCGPGPSMGKVETYVHCLNDTSTSYHRMKTLFRFHTREGKEIEILIESRANIS